MHTGKIGYTNNDLKTYADMDNNIKPCPFPQIQPTAENNHKNYNEVKQEYKKTKDTIKG